MEQRSVHDRRFLCLPHEIIIVAVSIPAISVLWPL
jgi:hypothetical protein